MKALFISGPKAGCVIDVDRRMRFVDIPVSNGVFRYRVLELSDGCNIAHNICAPDDINPLKTLIDFYAEAKHP